MANATVLRALRGFDKTQVAVQELQYAANKSNDSFAKLHWWRKEVRIGDFTAAAAVTQEIDLHDDLTTAAQDRKGQSGLFPANVILPFGAYLRRITDFSGGAVAPATASIGDTGDDNGFLTATNIFTGAGAGFVMTSGAAQFAARPEAALIPTLALITTVANIDALTAGALEVAIPYYLLPRDTDSA